MQKPRSIRQTLLLLLASSLLIFAEPASVYAGIITTSEIVNTQQIKRERDRLQSLLNREDVREALRIQGVDAVDAKERVANMTDMEIRALASKMDMLPAGGRMSNLQVVLVVLLIVILI